MNTTPLWQHHAHGKLLITGEYAVLDGALALALPVRYGQSLRVETGEAPNRLLWNSLDRAGKVWFKAAFTGPDFTVEHTTHAPTSTRLQQMLRACRAQNPQFLNDGAGYQVFTQTGFPREWGLGTSSTLIALLARWAEADPYEVLFDTLGGSGYDIACACAEGPLLYRLDGRHPNVQAVDFKPPFADQLFFVFLGKKQNSREGIQHYRRHKPEHADLIENISTITRQCLQCREVHEFARLLLEHERLIGEALGLPRAQDLYFPDFPGVVKSLGAWGGDFVLAAGNEAPQDINAYFRKKGYDTCISYADMVL